MRFLEQTEVEYVTGRKKLPNQIRTLNKMKIPFRVNAANEIIIVDEDCPLIRNEEASQDEVTIRDCA